MAVAFGAKRELAEQSTVLVAVAAVLTGVADAKSLSRL